jgi:hypothetical protein
MRRVDTDQARQLVRELSTVAADDVQLLGAGTDTRTPSTTFA